MSSSKETAPQRPADLASLASTKDDSSVVVPSLFPTPQPALKPFSYEWILESRGSTFTIVMSMSFAVFTDIFVYSIIVPVIPFVLESRLGVDEADVQSHVSKILALYSVGLIVGSVVFGYIADRISHRRSIMLLGLIVLTGATVVLLFAKSMAVYMVGRVIQGVSAAVVWVVGLAIIADVGTSNNIAYLMSFPAVGLSFGMFLGPLIGGVVYEKAGYNAVFYVCFGVLAVDIALRLIMLERGELKSTRAKHCQKLFDAGLEKLSMPLQHYVILHLPSQEPELDENVEDQKPEKYQYYMPIWKNRKIPIPAYLALMGNTRILNSFFLSIILAWLMTAFESILTLHVESIFDFSSLQAGLIFIAFAGPSFFEPVIGHLSDKVGPRFIVFSGLLLATPALILMRIPSQNTPGHIAGLSVLLVAVGLCISAILAPVTGEFSNAVSKFEAKNPGSLGRGKGFGQVYGLFNIAYSLGSLIGPFQAGGIVASKGWNTAVLSLGIVTFITAFITLPFTGGNILERRRKNRQQDAEAVIEQ